MAAAGGIQFGTAGTTGASLFQLGGNKTTASAFPSFGTAATTAAGGFSFGLQSSTAKATTSTAVGATPLFSLSGSSTAGTSTLLGNATAQQATTSTSFNIFNKPTTSTATVAPFGLATTSTAAASAANQPFLGIGTQNALAASSTATTTTTSIASQKQPDNPKEAEIPPELAATVQTLEKHIKDQKAKKDEISRFSCKAIMKVQEEIGILKQSLSIVSNGIQRDGIGVEMLKMQAAHDLRNAEIAQNVKEMAPNLQHEYTAPIEYFQRLIQSFEDRINVYKQELDDLENYLSSASPAQEITPQGLLDVLKKLGDTFLALTAQMQAIHEEVKILKNKYLQYRKVILGDSTNMFNQRKKGLDGNGRMISAGPSPFTALAGPTAVAMATALNANVHRPAHLTAVIGTAQPQQSSLFKPSVNTPGLSRSLSFGGVGGQKTGLGQPATGLGSSMAGKSAFGTTQTGFGTGQAAFGSSQSALKPATGLTLQPSAGGTSTTLLNPVTPMQQPNRFQLQSPPSGTKRGKLK